MRLDFDKVLKLLNVLGTGRLKKTLARSAIAATLLCTAMLAACETPAPYAPRMGGSTGYTDQQLAANRWRVTFAGNTVTRREVVENYLLLRAAEITLNAGYQWFVFDTRAVEPRTRYYTQFEGWGPGFYRPFGWYWHGWDYANTYASTRYNAYAEIVLLTPGQAKAEPRALAANDVIEHLRSTVTTSSR